MREIVRNKWFWIIAAVALLLRVWHLWHAAQSPTFWAPAVDPLWYHEAGQRVASGEFGPWPLWRAPLYPWLLGAVYALVENDLLWARLLNVALQLAALVLLYRMTREYFDNIAARAAGALFALNGMVIFFCAEIVSTSLELLLAALVMWGTLALRRTPSVKQALVCGVLWGLAALTRPNFLLVAPVILLVALWPHRTALVRLGLAALLGLALTIAPISLANWLKGGEFVMIATQGGVNYWLGNNPTADGISSILPEADRFWTMDQAESLAEKEVKQDLRPGELSDYYYEKGRDWQFNHPGLALKLMVRKAALFFNRFEVSNNKHITYFAGETPGLNGLILLNFALLLPLAVLALWSTRPNEARLLWGMVLTYAITVTLFFIASRFRMPVVPVLAILAGVGLASWPHFAKSQWLRAGTAATVVLLLAISNPFSAHEADAGAGHYMEGNAYMMLGQLEQARTSFQAARSDPGSREQALLNLAVVEQRLGNLVQVRDALRDLVVDYPQSAPGWNNYGVVLEALGDSTEAVGAYQRALRADSTHRDARENLARVLLEEGKRLLRAGKPQFAQGPLTRSLNTLPSASAHYHLAVALGQSGFVGAQLQLERALELDPNYAPALSLLQQLQEAPTAAPTLEPASK